MLAVHSMQCKKKWNLIQNSPAVKKSVQPRRRPLWKKIKSMQGGGQEMAVIVG